jgi:hypothetical protein
MKRSILRNDPELVTYTEPEEVGQHDLTSEPRARTGCIRQSWFPRELSNLAAGAACLMTGRLAFFDSPNRVDTVYLQGSPLVRSLETTSSTCRPPCYSDIEAGCFALEFRPMSDPSAQGASHGMARGHVQGDASGVAPLSPEGEHSYRRFRQSVVDLLTDTPIEDGLPHPADELIANGMRENSTMCVRWIERIFTEFYSSRPAVSAGIVRCSARVDRNQVGGRGLDLARRALAHADGEVREAGVRALEAWGGPEASAILLAHEDSEPWLREYVQRVIADLSCLPM